jgi:CRP-like cAMP-binding protein
MTKPSRQPEKSDPKTNRILAILEPADYDALMGEAEVVPLKFRKRLYSQDEQVDAVHFPLTCMVSLLVTNDGTPQMEMATIGKEGVVGASEVLQVQPSMGLNLVQIPGDAVRIEAEAFRKIIGTRPLIQKAINQHLYALMRQILYGAACNRMHCMEERCARWLLMTHDRAGDDTFPLTQEFLSHMLGVRRATVNVATGMLKKAGFIRYVRGKMTVVDRVGLESATCKCYQAIIAVYDSLLPAAQKRAN